MLLKHQRLELQTNKKSTNNNISQPKNNWPQVIILLKVELVISRREEEIMKMLSMPLTKPQTFWLPSIVDQDPLLKSAELLKACFRHLSIQKKQPDLLQFSLPLATQEGQLDESVLERVAQLLESLRANIQEGYNDFAESNAVSVAAFNDQKERVGQTIARLEAQNERLQNKLDNLSRQIGSQSAIPQKASGKLQRNQQLWDYAQFLCSTFAHEYNYATQVRRNEIQFVAQLEELVESRFNQGNDENHERSQRLASHA